MMRNRVTFFVFLLLFVSAVMAQVGGDGLGAGNGTSYEGFSAFLQPQKIAVLSAETDGVIAEIQVEPQGFVAAGEPVVLLDSSLIELQVASYRMEVEMSTVVKEAEISLSYAKDNLDIISKLYGTEIGGARVGSEKEYKEARQRKELAELAVVKAKKEFELMKLNLEQRELLLDKHTIRAPMDAVVVPFTSVKGMDTVKQAAEGEMVRGGQAVAALMKVSMLRVSQPRPVGALGTVRLGQKALVYVQGHAEPIDGEVVFISPTVASTGQFNIEVEFANPLLEGGSDTGYRYQFRPGMRARIELSFE